MNREQLRRKYRNLWWSAPNDSEQEDAYGDVWYTIFQSFLDDLKAETPGITLTQLRVKYQDLHEAAPADSRESEAYRFIRVLVRWSPRADWVKVASDKVYAGDCPWVYQEFIKDVEALDTEVHNG